MATVEFRRMQQLRGAPSDWSAHDAVPLVGELALEMSGGRWRLKAGDGVTPFSALQYLGEQDDTARASTAALGSQVTTIDSRVSVVENAAGAIPGMQANIAATQSALGGKQDNLPPGNAAGDLLVWSGSAWTLNQSGAQDGTMLRFDALTGRWVPISRGGAGQVLTLLPNGMPAWQAAGSISVKPINLTGGTTVHEAFNVARPTVTGGDLAIVSWNGQAYVYTGAPGAAISNATASDFTSLGATTAWATGGDFTTPPGGASNVAVSPAVLLAWFDQAGMDAGTY